ncbi:unnamed protein product, partial [Prorocentrum cordatum]
RMVRRGVERRAAGRRGAGRRGSPGGEGPRLRRPRPGPRAAARGDRPRAGRDRRGGGVGGRPLPAGAARGGHRRVLQLACPGRGQAWREAPGYVVPPVRLPAGGVHGRLPDRRWRSRACRHLAAGRPPRLGDAGGGVPPSPAGCWRAARRARWLPDAWGVPGWLRRRGRRPACRAAACAAAATAGAPAPGDGGGRWRRGRASGQAGPQGGAECRSRWCSAARREPARRGGRRARAGARGPSPGRAPGPARPAAARRHGWRLWIPSGRQECCRAWRCSSAGAARAGPRSCGEWCSSLGSACWTREAGRDARGGVAWRRGWQRAQRRGLWRAGSRHLPGCQRQARSVPEDGEAAAGGPPGEWAGAPQEPVHSAARRPVPGGPLRPVRDAVPQHGVLRGAPAADARRGRGASAAHAGRGGRRLAPRAGRRGQRFAHAGVQGQDDGASGWPLAQCQVAHADPQRESARWRVPRRGGCSRAGG